MKNLQTKKQRAAQKENKIPPEFLDTEKENQVIQSNFIKKKMPDRATMVEVIYAKKGIRKNIAAGLHIVPKTLWEWECDEEWLSIEIDKAYQQGLSEGVDLAEEWLDIHIKGIPKLDKNGEKIIGWFLRPDVAAAIFKLKTQGKNRGYVESPNFNINKNVEMPKIDIVFGSTEDFG